MTREFAGYLRKDGRAGIRNEVAVISAIDSLNPVAAKIADLVRGSVLVTDLFGRKMGGKNHAIRIRSLTGMAMNPNVGAVLVVSLHMPSALSVAGPIAESGKDVEIVAFQDVGSTLKAIEQGARLAVKLVKACSTQRRQAVPLACLTLGVECGGSDFSSGISGNPAIGRAADLLLDQGGTVILSETPEIMGAEHILARRAVSREVGDKLLQCVREMEMLAKATGFEDVRASNPSADNRKGGLSTLAEKSLGAVLKAGSKPLQGVLDFAERPPGVPGFYFMTTPAPACESMTGLAAGGAQVIVFNTGLGNPIANPIAPTIKVTGNPFTYAQCPDDFDVSVSDIISGGMTLEAGGERIFREMLDVASGKKTYSEILGITQSTIQVLGPSV
ncbi:MAG: UxaA family hydrolase [Deltaproteobacteria bacterium]|nr:UxaA family hydrolase [Deltaproteobacteria bacterium]